MNRSITIFTLLLPLVLGCSSSHVSQQPDYLLSDVWFNDQQINQAIINQEPDYGIDGQDVDFVKKEFIISIDVLELDTEKNKLKIKGIVIGKESKERLWGVNFRVITPQKKLNRIGERSIFKGRFILESNYFEGDLVEISYPGYRTIFIDPTVLVTRNSN